MYLFAGLSAGQVEIDVRLLRLLRRPCFLSRTRVPVDRVSVKGGVVEAKGREKDLVTFPRTNDTLLPFKSRKRVSNTPPIHRHVLYCVFRGCRCCVPCSSYIFQIVSLIPNHLPLLKLNSVYTLSNLSVVSQCGGVGTR